MTIFNGTPGDDVLRGNTYERDTFYGSAGSDLISGGATVQGNFDTLSYERLLAGVTITIDSGEGGNSGTVRKSGGGTDTFSGIIGPITATPFDDTIIGTTFAGYFLRTEVSTRALIGGLGNDTIDGRGNAYNLVSYADAHGVTVNLRAGTAVSDQGNDTLVNVVSVLGSPDADRITGSDASDVIYGGAGNDIILGGLGNDRLDGGAGDDIISGGGGTDTVSGGQGTDTLLFAAPLSALAFAFGGSIASPDGTITNGITGFERIEAGGVTYATRNGVNVFLYYANNPDVARAGRDAAEHYHTDGWHEGRNPNAYFSTITYRSANPDIYAAAIDPLEHYVTIGWREGRDPGATFDNETYLARNPDVAAAGINPLVHYIEHGREEGRATGPAIGPRVDADGFDAEWYALAYLGRLNFDDAGLKAHYRTVGYTEGRNPNAYFDTAGYLDAYADIRAAGVDPLAHYMTTGWKENRDPSRSFDTSAYLAANPDVAAAGLNPLLHYLQYGHAEGRLPLGDSVFDTPRA